MMNFDNDSGRLAAEAEALMALVDAELYAYADDPTHPDHIPMLSDEELLAMAQRAFSRASAIVAAETIVGREQIISDNTFAEVLATWTAELGLMSVTRKAATLVEEGRAWKVRVTDPDLVGKVLGPDSVGPLFMTIVEAPVQDGIAVTVRLPLRSALAAGIALVAVIDYGDGVRARIPLHQVDLGEAAAQAGLAELSGKAVVSTNVAVHPVLTLNVLTGP